MEEKLYEICSVKNFTTQYYLTWTFGQFIMFRLHDFINISRPIIPETQFNEFERHTAGSNVNKPFLNLQLSIGGSSSQELSLSNNIKTLNPEIFATWYCNLRYFKLKLFDLTELKDIRIEKSDFMARTKVLLIGSTGTLPKFIELGLNMYPWSFYVFTIYVLN